MTEIIDHSSEVEPKNVGRHFRNLGKKQDPRNPEKATFDLLVQEVCQLRKEIWKLNLQLVGWADHERDYERARVIIQEQDIKIRELQVALMGK